MRTFASGRTGGPEPLFGVAVVASMIGLIYAPGDAREDAWKQLVGIFKP